MDPQLDRLLERSRKGDPDAWSALVDRLQSLVYSVPRRYALDEDDAADVFMLTFGALHRNLDRIENAHALPRWMARTAARECLRLRRLHERSSDVPLEDVVQQDERDAEREAIKAVEALQVRDALDDLGAGCRELLQRLYSNDPSSYAEIARALNVSTGAIGPMRARCLDKLRRIMHDKGFFDP